MMTGPAPILAHVTLDTGDIHPSPRSAAREHSVALLRASLARAPLSLLHRQGGRRGGFVPRTEPGDPPRPPWLAVRMEAMAPSIPPADLLWLADFERTLAWAWLDHVADLRRG